MNNDVNVFIKTIITTLDSKQAFKLEKDPTCWWGFSVKTLEAPSLLQSIGNRLISLFWNTNGENEQSYQKDLESILDKGVLENHFHHDENEIRLFDELSRALRDSGAAKIAEKVDQAGKILQTKSTEKKGRPQVKRKKTKPQAPVATEPATTSLKKTETVFAEDLSDLFAQSAENAKEKSRPKEISSSKGLRPDKSTTSSENHLELKLPEGEKPEWAKTLEKGNAVSIPYGKNRQFSVDISDEAARNLLGIRFHNPEDHQLNVELFEKAVEKFAKKAYQKLKSENVKGGTIDYNFYSEQVERDGDGKELKRGQRSFGKIVFRYYPGTQGEKEKFMVLTCYEISLSNFEKQLQRGQNFESWAKENPPIELYCKPIYLGGTKSNL